MAKLVILNQGMTGRTFELVVERTTVGRVEDNTFQIADGSVSSHHAEILLRGTEILVRDLNSTNGTFLNGVTRQRVIRLLRDAGIKVHERSIKWSEFLAADEVFSTGNWSKVAPITRVEQKSIQPGPVMQKARDLYWDYALGGK